MNENVEHNCLNIMKKAFTVDVCFDIMKNRNDVELSKDGLTVSIPGSYSDIEVNYIAPKDRHASYVEGIFVVIFAGTKLTVKTNKYEYISDLWMKANDIRLSLDSEVISLFHRNLIGICNNNNIRINA